VSYNYNITAQSWSLNITPYNPRHTTMPKKKQVKQFTGIIYKYMGRNPKESPRRTGSPARED